MITIASSNFMATTPASSIYADSYHPESPSGHGYCPNPRDRGVGGYTAKTLLPGEKLILAGSTLINSCDRPMEVWYFGPAENEADIRPDDDFDLIYTIPDAPYFQYVFYEINHGKNSCFTLFESTQMLSDTHFLLARISSEQLTEIEKKWQKPVQAKNPNIEAKKAYEEGKKLMWGSSSKRDLYKAMDLFDKAISLDPTDYRFWAERALCWCMVGEHKQAIPDYLQAYKLSGNLDYLVERACILIDCGRVEEAVPDLEFAASKGNLYAKQSLQRLAYGWDRDPDPHGGW